MGGADGWILGIQCPVWSLCDFPVATEPNEGYPNLPGYPTMSGVVVVVVLPLLPLCMNRYFENLVSIKYYFINR